MGGWGLRPPRGMTRCLLGVLAALCTASPADAAGPTSPLAHAGRWITDAQGRVAIFHGVNMVYKLPPYDPAVTGFDADDARFLKSEGFNNVRLGIIYKAVEPQPGVYDDAYIERIARTVDVLRREGIQVLLDLHQDQYNERFQGEGFPDWAVLDDNLPAEPKVGFPGNSVVMLALLRAYDHFWNNDPPAPGRPGLGDSYAAAWRHIAQRFRGTPGLIGYDLINEPWAGTSWPSCADPAGCPVFDTGPLTAMTRRVLAQIRTVDQGNLVWYEPNSTFNNGADTSHAASGEQRAGMSFHIYCLLGSALSEQLNAITQGLGCDALEQLVFDHAESHATRTGDALFLTEFGATDDLGTIQRLVGEADRNMMSWQYWHYCPCSDPSTTGPAGQAIVLDPARPPSGDNLKAAKLGVLVRPYPQVVAGTPQRFSFDAATTTFDFSYSTARAGGGGFSAALESEVYVPPRQYPTGYRADVTGAAIASTANASLLRLVACPGARQVTVRVQSPGGRARDPDCTLGEARLGATSASKRRLRLTVTPSSTVTGRSTRFRFRVTLVAGARSAAVTKATIRFAGRRLRTDSRGRAGATARFRRPGRVLARASKSSLGSAQATVRVRPARRPRFTG